MTNIYDKNSPHKENGLIYSNTRFGSVSKNFNRIVNRFVEDEELIRLLVRTDSDAKDDTVPITREEKDQALNRSIRTTPVNPKDKVLENFIFVGVSNIVPLGNGNSVSYAVIIDIACNIQNWVLDDGTMRHIEILGRIDALLNATKMDSFGSVRFIGANALKINEEMSGLTAIYSIGELN